MALGVVPKNLMKTKCNQYDLFLLVLLKSSCTTFKTIFETLSALRGLSRDHYWVGGIKGIYVFEVFSKNLNDFSISPRKIFFWQKDLTKCLWKILITSDLCAPVMMLKVPIFAFFGDLRHFSNCLF